MLQERHTVPVREPEGGEGADLPNEHGVIRESHSVSQTEHSEVESTTVDEVVTHASSLWDSIKHEPQLGRKLVGTAGAWFLFDVLFYGNTLFQPIVMETAFGGGGGENALRKVATDSLILSLIALPGYILSAILMGRPVCYITQTPRFVQMEGFVVMGMLYAIIGSYWSYLKRVPWLLVLLYGSTFFFANYGPNTTTFIFPSLVYSPECRSTLNGISAAAGKAGALFGATLFEPASRAFGDDKVMLICAGVSVLGFAITHFFVRLPPVSSEARGL
jgi:PHS family inorganic phosphate transporter-like MFS transporter